MIQARSKKKRSEISRKPAVSPSSAPIKIMRRPLYKKFSGRYSYQADIVKKALVKKTLGIFAEQRTGKTWITLGILEQLQSPTLLGLLVVPLTNKESTWAKNLAEQLPGITVARTIEQARACVKSQEPCVLLLHYEEANKYISRLVRLKFTIIVYDESQRLKDRGSKSSRSARKLRNSAEYKVLLSGTPLEKSPMDAWAQFRFLKPDLFGDRWEDFKLGYLRPTGYMGYKLEFRKDRLKKFLKKIKPYSVRIEAEEVGIKKPIKILCPVSMKGKQKRYYWQMLRKQYIQTDNWECTAELAITRQIKLSQITGGYVHDDDGEPRFIGSAKLKKLKALMPRMKFPLVIFCRFKPEIEHIYRLCKSQYSDNVEILWGKVKDKKKHKPRTDLLLRFQRGEVDILICQVKTGGVGVDLYASSNAIVYSLGYSFIDWDQLFARLNAHGKSRRSRFFLLYAKESVDEDIYSDLSKKGSTSNSVMTPLKLNKGP